MFADIKYKFEKLEYLREIQRLKSAISCYQESENFAGKDVSVFIPYIIKQQQIKRDQTRPKDDECQTLTFGFHCLLLLANPTPILGTRVFSRLLDR